MAEPPQRKASTTAQGSSHLGPSDLSEQPAASESGMSRPKTKARAGREGVTMSQVWGASPRADPK